jgi:hypothetical protein
MLTALLLLAAAAAAEPAPYPPLVIENAYQLGGLGRLDYVPAQGGYAMVDGRFTPYVIDAGAIRPMRVDERGGAMAKPAAFWSAGGATLALMPSQGALLRLNPDFSVAASTSFGDFRFQGTEPKSVALWRGIAYFFVGDRLVAYDATPKKVGELKVARAGYSPGGFVIEGGKLYAFEGVDTGPYTDCVAPAPRNGQPPAHINCGERYDAAVVATVSDPAHMRFERDEKVPDENPPTAVLFKGIDAERGAWLLATGYGPKQTLQLRRLDALARVAASAEPPGMIFALTPSAPFYAVLRQDERLVLVPIAAKTGSIEFGAPLDLGVKAGPVVLKRRGTRLFVSAGDRLRVVDVSGAPRLELARDFHDGMGEQFQIRDFAFADGLPAPSLNVDRARIEALLGLRFLGPQQQRELGAELARLGPDDGWAIAPLVELLGKQNRPVALHALAARGLGRIGPGAKEAIPALLDASMQGGAIMGAYTPALQEALAGIDPAGDAVVDALPDFEARHYRSAARYVAKNVLKRLGGEKARAALANYR